MERGLPELIRTDRLLLREPRSTDAHSIFLTYAQDAEVAHYMTWRPHVLPSETESFIQDCIHAWWGGSRMPFVMTLRESEQQPLGMLEARVTGHTIDLGYALARRHWGRGLMPEAITALSQVALRAPGLFRVQATCDVENQASSRALEKSGFIREGRLERLTVHPNISAEPRACYIYAFCR